MIVMKFGGTSIEDATAMRNAVRIVKSHLKDQPILVVSAIARATNELEQIARTAALGEDAQAKELVAGFVDRHSLIIDQLLTDERRKSALQHILIEYKESLEGLVDELARMHNPSAELSDAICSHGERLSSRIVADALDEAGVPGAWIDVRDFMYTDENFGRARPVMEKVKLCLEERIKPLMAEGKTPVTQGFIGITESGRFTTMGRESSDYSATIIGSALGAKKVQIWTDVDGVLTADPRVVPTVKKVRHLSFGEAFRLSHFGAKVLHPATMTPIMEKRIPLEIMNSKKEGSGTLVDGTSQPAKGGVKSIAHKRGLAILRVGSRFGNDTFARDFMKLAPDLDPSFLLLSLSDSGAVLLTEQRRLGELARGFESFGTVSTAEGKGSLCLVGEEIMKTPGVAKSVFDALATPEVDFVLGAEDGMTIVLSADRLNDAVRELHQVFFDKIEDPIAFDTVSG